MRLGLLSQRPRYLWLKMTVTATLAMSYLLYRLLYSGRTTDCLIDTWHDMSLSINQTLNNGSDNLVIGIGQLMMDGWLSFMIFYWLVRYKTARPLWAFALFFMIRSIVLNLIAFPFPDHLVWHSPGFFSFTVPYDHTRDFYFSGHTGSLTVLAVQSYTIANQHLFPLIFMSLIYMIAMLTIVRVHYTVDVIGGVIFALFMHSRATEYIRRLDWLLGLPYTVTKVVILKIKVRWRRRKMEEEGAMVKEELQ